MGVMFLGRFQYRGILLHLHKVGQGPISKANISAVELQWLEY